MIGISARTFDPTGAIYFYRDQLDRTTVAGLHDRSRRVTKYKTLDGGVSVVDRGHAPGDRSLAVGVVEATMEQVHAITALAEAYAQLVLTTPDGAFLVCPESVQADGSTIKINLSFISEA